MLAHNPTKNQKIVYYSNKEVLLKNRKNLETSLSISATTLPLEGMCGNYVLNEMEVFEEVIMVEKTL